MREYNMRLLDIDTAAAGDGTRRIASTIVVVDDRVGETAD
jgi:hypothetical protein